MRALASHGSQKAAESLAVSRSPKAGIRNPAEWTFAEPGFGASMARNQRATRVRMRRRAGDGARRND
jgi:hypothetical protein